VNFRGSVIIVYLLWHPEVSTPGNFVTVLCFLVGKATSYGNIFKIMLRKFTWRHRSTLLGSNVAKFVRREIGEMVRYLPDKK